MPLYRTHITSSLSPEEAIERIRVLTKPAPGLLESFRDAFTWTARNDQPFLGKVEGNSFRLRRDIRYRNSFLPFVHGSVQSSSSGLGSDIRIVMFLHPVVAAFMLFWLSIVGKGAWHSLKAMEFSTPVSLIPLGMFIFGIALTCSGFFPEVIKAKRLLKTTLDNSSSS